MQAFNNVTAPLRRILEYGKTLGRSLRHIYISRERLDLFGKYYFLDASASGEKCRVLHGEQARLFLLIKENECFWDMLREYLINVSDNCIPLPYLYPFVHSNVYYLLYKDMLKKLSIDASNLGLRKAQIILFTIKCLLNS